MMPIPGDVTQDQMLVIGILLTTIVLFIWGRWRHDIVAATALLACVLVGLIPAAEAFQGFGHPAVITVACVLILSRGLQNSGAIDVITRKAIPSSSGPIVAMTMLTILAAGMSAFMNNVGALALLMPVAIQIANRQGLPPGRLLMPLAFGSILGGMTTMIGTPPNLIVSGFRLQADTRGFAMFDFAPVGLIVAAAGIAFILLIGWRLVPQRERKGVEGFDAGRYLTEARVPDKAAAAGMTLREIEKVLDEADAQVVSLLREEIRMPAPHPLRKVRADDILVIEAEPEALASAISALGLKLVEDIKSEDEQGETDEESQKEPDAGKKTRDEEKRDSGEEITLMEFTVLPNSSMIGRSASDVRLRARYGINLLAVSRRGRRSTSRLRTTAAAAGDVLLLQGAPDSLSEFASLFGLVPLAERALRLPNRRHAWLAGGIMAGAVTAAAFGLLPAAIAFAGGVIAVMVLRIVPPRTVYDAVDWPVIVLLATLIPVAGAMASTGAAAQISEWLLTWVARGDPIVALVLIIVVTMTLTNFMNNAATAAAMCPIALGTAAMLGVDADPFLMAVAVGASCAFLTPIGHQNSTLILGPGGFRFADYWRLGLPLEIIVLVVSVPAILLFWPL